MQLTREQNLISRKNRRAAREYFGIYGDTKYVLHHIDPAWKEEDPERYIKWDIKDVVVMEAGAHSAYHNSLSGARSGPMEESVKRKISETLKGRELSEEHRKNLKEFAVGRKHYHKGDHNVFLRPIEIPRYEAMGYIPGRSNYPKHRTEEDKRKKSAAQKGKKMYTNGEKNMWIKEGDIIPDGFYLGKTIKKNKVF